MKRVTLAAFPGRILNTHPALLPKFGGQGMFGNRVFEAVLAAQESASGASVHLVESDYDTGTVVYQARVPVLPDDTVESLKASVQAAEREAVVGTLAAVAGGDLVLGPRSSQTAPLAADRGRIRTTGDAETDRCK